jgi:hypothetical protein
MARAAAGLPSAGPASPRGLWRGEDAPSPGGSAAAMPETDRHMPSAAITWNTAGRTRRRAARGAIETVILEATTEVHGPVVIFSRPSGPDVPASGRAL